MSLLAPWPIIHGCLGSTCNMTDACRRLTEPSSSPSRPCQDIREVETKDWTLWGRAPYIRMNGRGLGR